MPDNVYAFVVTCPASTLSTAPIEVPLTGIEPGIARRCTITIPDGHSGLTGIALAFGHNAVIPSNTGAFISGNDHTFPFDMTDYPAGVSWSVFVCNLDLQPHTWQVIFESDDLPIAPGGSQPAPPSAADVMAAATAALGGP